MRARFHGSSDERYKDEVPARFIVTNGLKELFEYVRDYTDIKASDYIRHNLFRELYLFKNTELMQAVLNSPDVTSDFLLEEGVLDSCLELFIFFVNHTKSLHPANQPAFLEMRLAPFQSLLASGKFNRAHFVHDGKNLCQMISSSEGADLLSEFMSSLVDQGYCLRDDFGVGGQ